ncbi:MAG: methyltransferase domain-containing protein [SAR202 cluster bacterium]|nr:methyltransferase domain-containing protein [SAR202 cluster bacterium]
MNLNISYWDSLADWFDRRQGDEGDLWHRALINPTVVRVLGPVHGQQVLDLACGNGALARQLARAGARVTGVDASSRLVTLAQRREAANPMGISYHVSDATRLAVLRDASVDAVVCNMGLMDIADAEAAIQEVSRVLKPNGRFVASIVHPCFDQGSGSAWVVEKSGHITSVWRKVGHYRALSEGVAVWNIGPGQVSSTPHYHRPLSWYFRAFKAAGFVVTGLEEPEPTQEFLDNDSEGQWIQEIPLHCVFEAWKVERA